MAEADASKPTIHIAGLAAEWDEEEITDRFSQYGEVLEVRLFSKYGFAFVRMDTHANAAVSILNANGHFINEKKLRCSVSPVLLLYRLLLTMYCSGSATANLQLRNLRRLHRVPATPPYRRQWSCGYTQRTKQLQPSSTYFTCNSLGIAACCKRSTRISNPLPSDSCLYRGLRSRSYSYSQNTPTTG